MQGNIALGALVLLLLAVLLLMFWLSAHPRFWRHMGSADEATIGTIADDDEQQAQAAHAAQRKGLDKGKIEALPIFIYEVDGDQEAASMESVQGSAGEDGVNWGSCNRSGKQQVECPVCLSEFQDKERGRELPYCNHRFHVECIDTWLQASATCPVCRASCGGEEQVVVQVMGDQRSVISGIQYPTNVLFWGSNSIINARVHSLDGPQQERGVSAMVQIHTAEQPLDAAPSPPSISPLNPLRRLLSREMRPSATRERRPTTAPAPSGPSIATHSHVVFQTHIKS